MIIFSKLFRPRPKGRETRLSVVFVHLIKVTTIPIKKRDNNKYFIETDGKIIS